MHKQNQLNARVGYAWQPAKRKQYSPCKRRPEAEQDDPKPAGLRSTQQVVACGERSGGVGWLCAYEDSGEGPSIATRRVGDRATNQWWAQPLERCENGGRGTHGRRIQIQSGRRSRSRTENPTRLQQVKKSSPPQKWAGRRNLPGRTKRLQTDLYEQWGSYQNCAVAARQKAGTERGRQQEEHRCRRPQERMNHH